MTLIDELWEKTQEKLYVTRDEFDASLVGWSIEPMMLNGDKVGIMTKRGAEFHFVLLGTKTAMPMRAIKEWLAPQLKQHGHVFTRTPKNEVRQQRFNELIGFFRVGEDDLDIHYRYEGGPRCRS